eukprot:1155402-Pelagomonas_calceolata.AAC.8
MACVPVRGACSQLEAEGMGGMQRRNSNKCNHQKAYNHRRYNKKKTSMAGQQQQFAIQQFKPATFTLGI